MEINVRVLVTIDSMFIMMSPLNMFVVPLTITMNGPNESTKGITVTVPNIANLIKNCFPFEPRMILS
jgi:hypothetical protein